MFSPGSDIYCFGNLMWQTLKTFDCPANMRSAFMKEQREVANFTSPKVIFHSTVSISIHTMLFVMLQTSFIVLLYSYLIIKTSTAVIPIFVLWV